MDINTVLSLVQILAYFFGGWYFIGSIDKRVSVLIAQREAEHELNTKKFDAIEDQLRDLNKTTMQIALQENRLNAVDDRIKDLNIKLEAMRDLKLLSPPKRRIGKSS